MSLLSGAKGDIGVLEHHIHSRWRVYPQNISNTVQLTAAAEANTFGSWALVIPLNAVLFDFDIIGMVVDAVSAATYYHIQLGYNPENAEPGENMEMGERRLKIVTQPIARATEILTVYSQNIPANSTVWARLKTATGNEDTADISLVLSRHIDVSRELPLWPAFPW